MAANWFRGPASRVAQGGLDGLSVEHARRILATSEQVDARVADVAELAGVIGSLQAAVGILLAVIKRAEGGGGRGRA